MEPTEYRYSSVADYLFTLLIDPCCVAVTGGPGVRPDVVPEGSAASGRGSGGGTHQLPPPTGSGATNSDNNNPRPRSGGSWQLDGSPRTPRRADLGRSSSRADVVSVSDVRLEPKDENGTPSRLSINNSSGREALAILVKWHAPPT